MGIPEWKASVKEWYDGFCFGTHRDIYNPWSITSFIKERKLKTYWANTSENALVNKLIQAGPSDIKIALKTFSYFDTGKDSDEKTDPERFYHGFVLGLIVDLAQEYRVTSNRESGLGRYDVVLEPYDKGYDTELIERGIPKDQIRYYGFAFEGKQVLIG